MGAAEIVVNRAPVLTLWAAVVAERCGHPWDAALSLGKAVAGLNAQSKGRMLGIYGPPPEGKKPRERRGEERWIQVCGRAVPARDTPEGLRALKGAAVIGSQPVERYLGAKLKEHYEPARRAMRELAGSYDPGELEDVAYSLYERFRPKIPPGKRGWGVAGKLDLNLMRSLARDH